MPHKSQNRVPDINFNRVDDKGWPTDTVAAAVLFNIRDTIEANERAAAARDEALLRVLRRIDRRLALRVKLR